MYDEFKGRSAIVTGYKQAEKITQTEADKIFHQIEKQKSVFDDMVDIGDEDNELLPF